MAKQLKKTQEKLYRDTLFSILGFLDYNSAPDEEFINTFNYNINNETDIIELCDKFIRPEWINITHDNMQGYIKNYHFEIIKSLENLLLLEDIDIHKLLSSFCFIFGDIENERCFLEQILNRLKKYFMEEYHQEL